MDDPVVRAAQEHEVLEAGAAAVDPMLDMVRVAHDRRSPAARGRPIGVR